jgi:hypothetical protein
MNKYSLFFVTFLTFLVSSITYAQALPPADGDGVPVDGGLTALLVGGAIYGAKKLKERKK